MPSPVFLFKIRPCYVIVWEGFFNTIDKRKTASVALSMEYLPQ
jgi:hypothetical protein